MNYCIFADIFNQKTEEISFGLYYNIRKQIFMGELYKNKKKTDPDIHSCGPGPGT